VQGGGNAERSLSNARGQVSGRWFLGLLHYDPRSRSPALALELDLVAKLL
jgi:hypothetical protein